MLKLFYNFIIFFNVPKRGRVGVLDWSRDFGEVPEKSPIFGVRLGNGKKVPESPMESPAIWGRFRRVPKSPETRNVGNG